MTRFGAVGDRGEGPKSKLSMCTEGRVAITPEAGGRVGRPAVGGTPKSSTVASGRLWAGVGTGAVVGGGGKVGGGPKSKASTWEESRDVAGVDVGGRGVFTTSGVGGRPKSKMNMRSGGGAAGSGEGQDEVIDKGGMVGGEPKSKVSAWTEFRAME
jgi:hypothetical protein